MSEIERRITRVLRRRGKMEVSEIVEELKEEFPDLRPNTIGRRVRELSQRDCIDRTGRGIQTETGHKRHKETGGVRVTDTVNEEKRSEIMSKIHSGKTKEKWTEMELKVHNWLKAKHIEHTMVPDIEGDPDVVLRNGGNPIFLFLDGCFWHACPKHYERPKSRQDYWREHIEERSEERMKRRRKLPYNWVRIWEHDINNGEFKEIIEETLNG